MWRREVRLIPPRGLLSSRDGLEGVAQAGGRVVFVHRVAVIAAFHVFVSQVFANCRSHMIYKVRVILTGTVLV